MTPPTHKVIKDALITSGMLIAFVVLYGLAGALDDEDSTLNAMISALTRSE